MLELVLLGLVSLCAAQQLINYHFSSVSTQVQFDFSLNNLHGVMGLTTLAESTADPKIYTTGLYYPQAPVLRRVTLPPNAFTALQVLSGSQFSFVFWINPTNITGNTLIEKYDTNAGQTILSLGFAANGGVNVVIHGSNHTTDSIGLLVDHWQLLTVLMDCKAACTVTAYRNKGETSAVLSTSDLFVDDPAIPFLLGFTQEPNGLPYMGMIYEFRLFAGLISLASLTKYIKYVGEGDCLASECDTLCSNIDGLTPQIKCLNSTKSALPSTSCTLTNCGASNTIKACVRFSSNECFMVNHDCDPACATCLNGIDSTHCSTCADPSIAVTTRGNDWGECLCPKGQYKDSGSGQCKPCANACAECSDGGLSSCSSCVTHAVLAGSPPTSCSCDAGYFFKTASGTCELCDSSCKQCSATSASSCTACYEKATLSSGVCSCASGEYFDATNHICSTCDATCVTCSGKDPSQCTSCYSNAEGSPGNCICKAGFAATPNSANCVASCDPTCQLCAKMGADQCTSCLSGAKLASGSPSSCVCDLGYFAGPNPSHCTACTPPCLTCIGLNAQCMTCQGSTVLQGTAPAACGCASGQYMTNDSKCLACDGTCAECKAAATSCSVCKSNAQLSGTVPSSCVCLSHYYPNNDSSNCVVCEAMCQTCSGVGLCTACYSRAQLAANPGVCQCVSGNFPDSDASNCSSCDSSCVTCDAAGATKCRTCHTNAKIVGTAPSSCQCDVGFYGLPTACQPCHSTCADCSGTTSSDCSSCVAPTAQLNGTAPSFCICDPGFYLDVTTCKSCDPTCSTCIGAGPSKCTSCSTHSGLAGGSGSNCICDSGFYPNTDSAHCFACDGTCVTCSGPADKDCVSCISGASVVSGHCTCPPAQYLGSTSCQSCDSTCTQCQGPGSAACTQCHASASLSGGAPSNCACQSGTFPSTTAANCQPCNSSCATCSDKETTKCLSCKSGAVLSGSAPNTCTCSAGTYPDPTVQHCSNCDPSCLTCSAGTNKDCRTCRINAALVAASPAECHCVKGAFLSGTSCLLCTGLCATCSSATVCLSCSAHSTLSGTKCECDSGLTISSDGTQCLVCDPSCKTCLSTKSSDCLSCKENGQLSSGSPSTCACVAGFYMDSGSCKAVNCDKSCLVCSSTGVCVSCPTHTTSPSGTNYCTCESGYFPQPDTSNCQLCSFQCLSCTDGSDSGCLQCKPNAVLSRPAPSSCHCIDGFHASPDSSNCTMCLQGCALCSSSASVCSKCIEHYFLGNSGCQLCGLTCLSCSTVDTCRSCQPGLTITKSGQCLDCPNCADPLVANITGPYQYDYNVTFSRPVTRLFNESDFRVASLPPANMSWSLPSAPNLVIRVSCGSWTNITSLLISFLADIEDIYGDSLSTKAISVPPPSDPAVSSTNQSTVNTTIATATQTIVTIVAASAVLLGSTVGGGSFAVALLSQMQYFSYISSGNSTTGTANSFYAGLNQKSVYPNFFKSSGPSKPGRRLESSEELITPADFLDSAGQYFTILVCIMTIHLGLFLLCRVFKWKWLIRLAGQFTWTVYLYFWYLAFLDLQISALLQLKEGNWQDLSPHSLINTILAIISLTLTLLTPFATYILIHYHRNQLTDTENNPVKQRFGALISSLRTDVSWAKYLIPIYYFQRVLFSFVIVFMRNWPLYQSLLLLIPSGIMAVFTIFTRPMQQKATRMLNIVCHLDVFMVFTLLCVATFQFSSPQVAITWVIIALTLKSFLCTGLIVVIHAVIGVKAACRKKPIENAKVNVEPTSKNVDFLQAMWANNTEISFEDMKKVTFDRAGESKGRKAFSLYSEVRTDTQESSPTKHVAIRL